MISNTFESRVSSDQTSSSLASDRVVDILSDRIRSGLYGVRELIPAERTLAINLGVQRRAVRTAVDRLVQTGLLSRRPNCRPTVADAPSEKVERALGKAPSTARLSTSNLIALIMWHGPLEHETTAQQRIFWGMNLAVAKYGYHAVFLNLGADIESEETNAAREARHLRYIQDQGFGGALFYPYAFRRNRDVVEEVNRTVPIVMLDRKIAGTDTDFVGVENRQTMYNLTRHLIAQGHRRIAHVTHVQPIQPVHDRIEGYFDAIRDADMDADPETREMVLHIPAGSGDRAWGILDTIFGLPKGQRPTAAVCSNDYMAAGLAVRLGRLGLSAPRDFALTGFDNIVPTLPDGTGLTTAAQPYEEIGMAAVDLLMRRLQDRGAPVKAVELPVPLILRESSVLENGQ